MKNENDLMDSLLREHAKSKGVDEQFLSELDKKMDAEDKGNVIALDQSGGGLSSSRKGLSAGVKAGLGLGIGVAACAAFYMAEPMLNRSSPSGVIALESEASVKQIETAKNSLREYELLEGASSVAPAMAEDELKASSFKLDSAEVAEEKFRSKEVTPRKGAVSPQASKAMKKAESKDMVMGGADARMSVPVPRSAQERALNFGDGNNFGNGWGSGEGSGAGFGERREMSDSFMSGRRMKPPIDDERYGKLIENGFTAPVDKETKRSTFAIDVDTASYANVRRLIASGAHVPADSVRIEEMVNYFDYQYGKPAQDGLHPFAVHVDAAVCPWNKKNKLVRIALQGKEVIREERPASNVVFLLDVSGSMNSANKLPLLKDSLKYLLEEMNEKDTISIVVYAGASGLVLPATKVNDVGRATILKSMEKLSAGGSTAGGAGIKLAYKIAQENFIKGGVNRVILATDGDFNVGVSDPDSLTKQVKESALKGVAISVLGFGSGNLNDNMLEMITNNGNGNYSYIDTIKEGRKVLLEDMMGTMMTIAKDVKIQVEFNPEKVQEYRLIGYSNRMLPNSAFLDKKADAGEIGAGHRVTAFYEIIPGKALDKSKLDGLRYGVKEKQEVDAEKSQVAPEHTDELLFVKLAYKQPEQKLNDESTYLSVVLKDEVNAQDQLDDDFKFASSVALFGMVLRDSEHKGEGNLDLVQQLAESGKGADGRGLREEFIKLVKKLKVKEQQHRNKE